MKRVAVVLLLVAACKNGPSQDQCKQLLDHLVDLEFKAGGAGTASEAMKQELAKSKAAVSDATSAAFLDTCTKKMTRTRVECALTANQLDGDNGVGKCDESK